MSRATGQVTALQLGYDGSSGRVATITDRNGASWDLGAPTPDDGPSNVTFIVGSSLAHGDHASHL